MVLSMSWSTESLSPCVPQSSVTRRDCGVQFSLFACQQITFHLPDSEWHRSQPRTCPTQAVVVCQRWDAAMKSPCKKYLFFWGCWQQTQLTAIRTREFGCRSVFTTPRSNLISILFWFHPLPSPTPFQGEWLKLGFCSHYSVCFQNLECVLQFVT